MMYNAVATTGFPSIPPYSLMSVTVVFTLRFYKTPALVKNTKSRRNDLKLTGDALDSVIYPQNRHSGLKGGLQTPDFADRGL